MTMKTTPELSLPEVSQRGLQWQAFSEAVLSHIENYTVPQYGDFPDDQASNFTIEEITMNMRRYLNRAGRNSRGLEEASRDTLKLAHYACMLNLLVQEAVDDPNTRCPGCGKNLGFRHTVCPACGYCENC